MKKSDVVEFILRSHLEKEKTEFKREVGMSFAPTNIALCKYWGKRDIELNLPMTSSLSVALPDRGALTHLTLHDDSTDSIRLNDIIIEPTSSFAKRTIQFLNLFRPKNNWHLKIDIKMNVPLAAGLASSACGFASLVAALNDLFLWDLPKQFLSILARLGSGSASRSFWNGFVEWQAGIQSDGMDSYASAINTEWPELYLGILPINISEKPYSSRDAMQRTVDTSILYNSWPKKVARDLVILRQSLHTKNFSLLGGTSESNALTMHATMLSAWPPISYILPETLKEMQKIWQLRRDGLKIYFTLDAGPNLKLLFLEEEMALVKAEFPSLEIIKLFD